MTIINLEPLSARYGMKIIEENGKNQETIVTKALGVLTENGIYAMALFLITCQEKNYGEKVLTHHLRNLWQENGVALISPDVQADKNEMLKAIQKMADNLANLILVKKITEQTLTFARYHAKAGSESTTAEGTDG